MGVWSKSYGPWRLCQADVWGLKEEDRNKLMVSSAWGNKRSHVING